MKYRKRAVVVEAITFEEFIEYGKNHAENLVEGMPWHFEYNGHPVSHDTDVSYAIPTLEGIMMFTPEDMLITGVNGEIYPCKKDIFNKTYELETKSGMTFEEAFKLMKQGYPVKLPSWGGYWTWDEDKETVLMHCRPEASDNGNSVLDIRETQRVEYTLSNIMSDEWVVATIFNTPLLGGTATFSFGEAIKYLKRGFKVKRLGWNGKDQYIELASNISFKLPTGEFINYDHYVIGNKAIAFFGTSGIQMGWLASQSDMLAEDWVFAE